MTGQQLCNLGAKEGPVRKAYRLHALDQNRPSWDLATILCAVCQVTQTIGPLRRMDIVMLTRVDQMNDDCQMRKTLSIYSHGWHLSK